MAVGFSLIPQEDEYSLGAIGPGMSPYAPPPPPPTQPPPVAPEKPTPTFGYPVREKLYPGEDDYFRKNPNVAGMAAEDKSIILNPYSPPDVNKQAVAQNEGFRLKMRDEGTTPDFKVTDEQRTAFKDTDYGKDENALKQTIAARIFSGDPSAKATEEQKTWVNGYLHGTQQKVPAPAAPPPKQASWREDIMSELDNNPRTKGLAMQMLDTEGGGARTMEALVNRVGMIRQKLPNWSIWDELNSGFYGPINRGYAQTRQLGSKAISQYEKDIAEVRAGSNLIQGRTDQGMAGDPNSSGPGRVPAPGGEIYNFWAGKRGGVDFSHQDSAQFAQQVVGGDLQLPAGAPTAPIGRVGHDTAPDGTRPMGEGIYIWPGETTGGHPDPSQPMGEGEYRWPAAQRASPQEVESARYGGPATRLTDLTQGTPFGAPIIPGAEPPPLSAQETAIAEASGFPWPKAQPPDVRFAEPVYGYTPSPTPVGGVARTAPFEPTAPTMITTPEGQQVADQWGFATFTQPGANQVPGLPSAPAAAPAAPQQPAPVAPAQVAAPTQPAPAAQQVAPAQVAAPATWQDWTAQHLNMLSRGAVSTGLLGTIQGLDGYLLEKLPDWPILNPIKENLRSEQKQAAALRNKLENEAFPASKEVQQKYSGQVAEMLGQGAFQLGLNFLTGGESGWVRGAANVASAVGQLFTEQREQEIAHGATPEQASQSAASYVHAAGPLEALVDHYIGGKLFKAAAAGKLTVGELAKQFLSGAAAEGMTEPAQQAIGNYLARTYDPNRPITEGMWDAAKVAALGGGLLGVGAHVTGRVAGLAEEKSKEKTRAEAAKQLEEIQLPGTELTEEEKKAFQREEAPPTAPPSEAVPPTAPSAEAAPAAPAPAATPEDREARIATMSDEERAKLGLRPAGEAAAASEAQRDKLRAAGYVEDQISVMTNQDVDQAVKNLGVKPSLAIPEEKPKVAIQTFDRGSKTFTQTEMEASPDLVHQLKAEESFYTRLINCL